MLPLRTERLTIRMMREADIPRLVAYRNDPSIGRFQDWELPFTDDAARRVIDGQAALHGPTNAQWVQLAVDLGEEMVGDVAVELCSGYRSPGTIITPARTDAREQSRQCRQCSATVAGGRTSVEA